MTTDFYSQFHFTSTQLDPFLKMSNVLNNFEIYIVLLSVSVVCLLKCLTPPLIKVLSEYIT